MRVHRRAAHHAKNERLLRLAIHAGNSLMIASRPRMLAMSNSTSVRIEDWADKTTEGIGQVVREGVVTV